MSDTPLIFSAVTGLTLALFGSLLGMGGLPGWGLAAVGTGILVLSLGSWLQQAGQAQPAKVQPAVYSPVILHGGERA